MDPNVMFDAGAYSASDPTVDDEMTWETVSDGGNSSQAPPGRYMPPHRRPVKEEMGDYFQVDMGKPDEQGVANTKFKKLMVFLSYALTKTMIDALARRFPGCFFVSKDHHNHDHPIAHAVTHVGTRFLQRMIKAGSNVLDVYGSPLACASFSASQRYATNPKVMRALVSKSCPADFIRAVNKWGPWVDFADPCPDGNAIKYDVGKVLEQEKGWLAKFDCFQMIHTLYYLTPVEISHLLSARRGSKILALIHSHGSSHGFLNEGEQEYWVKGGVVRQKNVKTNSVYYHKDITPFWFKENKHFDIEGTNGQILGDFVSFAWELHFVCDDTWIVEITGSYPSEIDVDTVDYSQLYALAEQEEEFNKRATLIQDCVLVEPVRILPTSDGKFIELDVVNLELFTALRRKATGRDRRGKPGRELLRELLASAKHLVSPGALLPGQEGLSCPPHLLFDHVISAFITDVVHETNVMKGVSFLHPVLEAHAASLRSGVNYTKFTTFSLVSTLRMLTRGGLAANTIVRARDPIGVALGHLDNALDFEQ
jgi:hypothetical protein